MAVSPIALKLTSKAEQKHGEEIFCMASVGAAG